MFNDAQRISTMPGSHERIQRELSSEKNCLGDTCSSLTGPHRTMPLSFVQQHLWQSQQLDFSSVGLITTRLHLRGSGRLVVLTDIARELLFKSGTDVNTPRAMASPSILATTVPLDSTTTSKSGVKCG